MSKQRVLAICLDAFDAPTARKMMAEGKLQGLKRVMEKSARFDLEHGEGGKARYTGLTMEHFSSGQKPDTAKKWSVVSFDPKHYETTQYHASVRPFFADLDAKVVVMDQPYFDLEGYTNIKGVVGWGGHDTGVNTYCYPEGLLDEMNEKFGVPESHSDLNTMVYPSVEQTKKMAASLERSARLRTDIAEWMYTEKFPDWDVAMIAFGETHDCIELFYHGLDADHHLAEFPSVPHARAGVEAVYEVVSDSIERLANKFPDAALAVFTMHGMGKNDTDLMTMLLMPEFMYRYNFGREMFMSRDDWKNTMSPALKTNENWEEAVIATMQHSVDQQIKTLAPRATRKVSAALNKVLGGAKTDHAEEGPWKPESKPGASRAQGMGWMPAAQYRPYWSKMKAFGVPAYFDGRIRINLKGREADGIVELADYKAILDDVETELRNCVDIKTGDPVVKEIERPGEADPLNLDDTQADIKIIWNGSPIGFRHPKFGDIGPAPVRRVGGHSGGYGALFVQAPGVEAGDYGLRSSFDVAPTIVDLMGHVRPNIMDGESVLEGVRKVGEPAE